jgi:hypothetical protein
MLSAQPIINAAEASQFSAAGFVQSLTLTRISAVEPLAGSMIDSFRDD